MPGLIPLDEFNRQRAREHGIIVDDNPRPSGILCPVHGCDGELWDTAPLIAKMTLPPTKAVYCPKCGWQGQRIADSPVRVPKVPGRGSLGNMSESVIRGALARYEAGEREHGSLDLATDSRDFLDEAIQELEDCINYCAFQIIRLKGVRGIIQAQGITYPSRLSKSPNNKPDSGACHHSVTTREGEHER